jgi:hypothetical protein
MTLKNLNHKPRHSSRCWHWQQSGLTRQIRPGSSRQVVQGVVKVGRDRGQETRSAASEPGAQEIKRVLALASRVARMSEVDLRERYHELVDKQPNLTSIERFELERIIARLDAVDVDLSLEARNHLWERERTELLASIEDLLYRLRESRL